MLFRRIWAGFFLIIIYAAGLSANTLLHNAFAYISQPISLDVALLMLGGYRYYSPQYGIFLKQDSISPFTNMRVLNGFDYAAGNPVMQIDASGHWPTGSRPDYGDEPVPIFERGHAMPYNSEQSRELKITGRCSVCQQTIRKWEFVPELLEDKLTWMPPMP